MEWAGEVGTISIDLRFFTDNSEHETIKPIVLKKEYDRDGLTLFLIVLVVTVVAIRFALAAYSASFVAFILVNETVDVFVVLEVALGSHS